jgi:hypothetical protein
VLIGGADGIRTHGLLDAIEARSQLRHGPTGNGNSEKTVASYQRRVKRQTRHAPLDFRTVGIEPGAHKIRKQQFFNCSYLPGLLGLTFSSIPGMPPPACTLGMLPFHLAIHRSVTVSLCHSMIEGLMEAARTLFDSASP